MDQIPFNERSIAYFLDEMQEEEKAELADSFLLRGELELLSDSCTEALELFALAEKCAPGSATLFYRQGIALFDYGSREGREKALFIAHRKFRTASTLDPRFFDNWRAWGSALMQMGKTLGAKGYFTEAEVKLRRAIRSAGEQRPEEMAELYWDYGIAWLYIAEDSGEAYDVQCALDAFERASALCERLPLEFWNSFGKGALLLAAKVRDLRFYVKAINCFKHAASLDRSSYASWALLAEALTSLYGLTHDENHFSQANACYAKASHLRQADPSLWLDWARLLISSGKRTLHAKRLRTAIEKCHQAQVYDPDNLLAVAICAEALARIGEMTDRLDLILDAQNKIAEVEEIDSGYAIELCYASGLVLSALGHYFQDADYYYQAIEQFQTGLSTDRSSALLWHAMATAFARVGDLEEDLEPLERASRFYLKAIDLNPCSFYLIDYAITLYKWGELVQSQSILENALHYFEKALQVQRNAAYLHPDWLFHYAVALDALSAFHDEESGYTKALEILHHVLMVDPDFPAIHHRLALVYVHRGELLSEVEDFHRSLRHFRFAERHQQENDQLLLDWGVTMINLSQHTRERAEAEQMLRDAEVKLAGAALLGHPAAHYHLAALYSIRGNYEHALAFLQKALHFDAFPTIEELLEDDWLEGVRATSAFRAFLDELEKRRTHS